MEGGADLLIEVISLMVKIKYHLCKVATIDEIEAQAGALIQDVMFGTQIEEF